MTTTWMAGVLAGTALICAAHPSAAQEKGKTEAAELAQASQAALKQLYATAPLAKELNDLETSGGRWIFEGVEKITPKLALTGAATTSIEPEEIRRLLEAHLRSGTPAWNPYD